MSRALRHAVVAYGEMLWDLLPAGATLGGAPLNFIYRVHSLGGRGLLASRVGRDELGECALRAAAELGLDTRLIQRDAAHPTGTVPVRFDARGNPEFTIVPEVAYDYIEPDAALEQAVEQAQVLCFGTLAQRSAVSRSTLWRLRETFRGRWALLDINLRRGCYSRQSIVDSVQRADILKANDAEARVLAEIYGLPGDPLPALARGLLGVARLSCVVITLGARGALALSREGELRYHPAYEVPVVDTVGSGDAFSAAFLLTLLRGGDLRAALREGSALGAMVAAQKGATQPVTPVELEEFRDSAPLAPAAPELAAFSG